MDIGIEVGTHVRCRRRIERGLNAISIDNYTCVLSEKFSNYAPNEIWRAGLCCRETYVFKVFQYSWKTSKVLLRCWKCRLYNGIRLGDALRLCKVSGTSLRKFAKLTLSVAIKILSLTWFLTRIAEVKTSKNNFMWLQKLIKLSGKFRALKR